MNKIIRYSLGVYQVVGAVVGLLLMGPSIAAQGVAIVAIVVLFSSLSFVSGIVLLVYPRIGWKLSIITQGMQVFGFSSPLFSYLFSEGIALRINLGMIGAGQGVMDTRFAFTFGARFGADFALAAFQQLQGFFTFGFYFNFMAAVTTCLSVRGLRIENSTNNEEFNDDSTKSGSDNVG